MASVTSRRNREFASFTAALAPGATQNIRADYQGDVTHNVSSSNIVTILSSTITLVASTTSTSNTRPVTLTATVQDTASWAAGGLAGTATYNGVAKYVGSTSVSMRIRIR